MKHFAGADGQFRYLDLALDSVRPDEIALTNARLDASTCARIVQMAPSRRIQSLAARALLFRLISGHLDVPPDHPKLLLHQKLTGGPQAFFEGKQVGFSSLAHTESRVAAAFSWTSPIGIDVELTSRPAHFDALSKKYFHFGTHAWIVGASGQGKADCFYRAWTLREALIKACGLREIGSLRDVLIRPCPQTTKSSIGSASLSWHTQSVLVDGVPVHLQSAIVDRSRALGLAFIAGLVRTT